MEVTTGDIVQSEFGTGKLIAITKEWIVHEVEDGSEVAVPKNGEVWVPAQIVGMGGGEETADLPSF